jgi:KipI family sensor histidine kinase inhibitor
MPAGESALVIELGNRIDPDINQRVYELASAIERASLPVVQEVVPTYRSLLVRYDPLRATYADMAKSVQDVARTGLTGRAPRDQQRQLYEIAVLYGGDEGPDLAAVAEHAGISEEEVVSVHTRPAYRVYMLGFAPGFPYLGGLDPRISCPRLKTPRTRVPAGSVGIAESQTGIDPLSTPGGWQIIGRTPVPLFDPRRDPPVTITPGSFLRFVRVSRREAEDISKRVGDGRYEIPVRRRGF